MMQLLLHTCQKALRTIVILSIFSSCSKERYEVIIKEDVQPPVVEKAIFKPSTENPLSTKIEAPFQKTINNPNDLNFTTTKGTIVKGRSVTLYLNQEAGTVLSYRSTYKSRNCTPLKT
jgi:hypothetical protein